MVALNKKSSDSSELLRASDFMAQQAQDKQLMKEKNTGRKQNLKSRYTKAITESFWIHCSFRRSVFLWREKAKQEIT